MGILDLKRAKNYVNSRFDTVLENVEVSKKDATITKANGAFLTYGTYFTGFGTQTYWRHTMVTCTPGDVYYVSLIIVNNTTVKFHIALCDENDKIIQTFLPYSDVGTIDDYQVTIPSGVTRMYIHSYTNGVADYLYVKKQVYLLASQQSVTDLSERVLSLETSDNIPAYFESHLQSKLTEIKQKTQQILNGDAFVFITDAHIGANSLSSYPMIREVLKQTSITKMIYGGDTCQAYGTKEYCINVGYIINDLFVSISEYGTTYLVRGNHDFTVKESVESSIGFTADRAFNYDLIIKNQEPYIKGVAGKLYYYADNDMQKIRYIFLDTTEKENAGETIPWGIGQGIYQEQLDWLINDALNVSTGWSVLVIGHTSCVTEIPAYSNTLDCVAGVLKALKNKTIYTYSDATLELSVNVDFTTKDTDVIAYMSGHNHKDTNATVDNLLFFSTTCDARYSDDGITRTPGTTDESAFDVVCVNTMTKTIDLIRVGAGSNRSFIY